MGLLLLCRCWWWRRELCCHWLQLVGVLHIPFPSLHSGNPALYLQDPNWATQALFSVGFQVFWRPFWRVPNAFRHYQKRRLSWGWLTKQKFQQSCHKYLKTSLLIQWNVWLAPIVNAFTENLTVRCHLGLVVSKNEKRLGGFLITFWYITKWLFF